MSKLGSGGLLGNSAALNLRREQDEEHPPQTQVRSSRSALGAVVTAGPSQPLAGAGGLTGEARQPNPPGSFNKPGQRQL